MQIFLFLFVNLGNLMYHQNVKIINSCMKGDIQPNMLSEVTPSPRVTLAVGGGGLRTFIRNH